MLTVDFNKTMSCPWNGKEINRVFYWIKQHTKTNGEVELNVVGDKEMKELNFHYRGFNKPTDVLSFAWKEDKVIKTNYLGQIYICYPQIVRQSKELSVNPKEEFVRMLAHGFLHIIGHDHGRKKEAEIMFGIQEKIVADYFKTKKKA